MPKARHDDRQATGSQGTPAWPGDGMPFESKLRPPRARPEWVERRDPIHLLSQAAARLILLAAPAGYGKTTLLAQWCARPDDDRSFAWVSLDQDDNDPTALWRLVIVALAEACPTPGLESLARAARGQMSTRGGLLLPGLIKELTALARPVTIVLDGYDVITSRECHEQLKFLLLRLPAHAHVVLSVRRRPPLGLARMRARGELAEIGPAELSMTAQDAGRLIAALCGAELYQPDLARLIDRTEGWPAGVYLVALSLCQADDPGEFMRRYTGGNRYIWDFFAEEVINRQPADIRQFLLQTSVLDRFSAPLAEAVTAAASAGEIIDILDRENLFLVPLDDSREWFRYHHLFSQTLLRQLKRADPGAAPALRLRASAWHRQRGQPGLAIHYAIAGGDAAAAIAVIAGEWHHYMDSGLVAVVRGWLARLGEPEIRASPLAAHCAAWIAAFSGDQAGVRRWLAVLNDTAPQGPLPDGMRSLEFSAALLQGIFGFSGIRPMAESAARAVRIEDDPQAAWYSVAQTALGAALYLSGELGAARQRLEEALLNNPPFGRARLLVCAYLCLVALDEGRTGQAQELAAAARDIVTDQAYGLTSTPQGAFAHLALGALYADQARLEEARRELTQALQARRGAPGLSPWPKLEILLRLVPVLQDLGDVPGAVALLGEAEDLLAFFPDGAQAQLARVAGLARRLGDYEEDAAVQRLTAREQAVLQWLEGTLSLSEIGKELYVSANTIKSHTRAIYRKLGVSNRREAVDRGRDLGLL